jgi:hypothetical protein
MSSEIGKFIESFRKAADEKGNFAFGKRDRQLYETMRASFHRLKEMGEPGNKALAQLLDDQSNHVRCWIAAALLVEGNSKARSVLETIANTGERILRSNAEITLEEFKKGTLGTPFPNRT